jgi:K+-sensing histidine kinase KdpD
LEFKKETLNILQILIALILSQDRLKIQDQAGVAELGLLVSYGMIKKHGGDLEIDSEPNIGSTVTLVVTIKSKKYGTLTI